MRFLARWIFRELRNDAGWTALFICSLALGLFGFVALQSLREALDDGLRLNARQFLSADFAMSSHRQIRQDELDQVRRVLKPARESRAAELLSMVAGPGTSRLVQIKAVDALYPLYGELQMRSGRVMKSGDLGQLHGVWVYPEVLSQLKVNVGDTVKIGEARFRIEDVITNDSTQTFRAGGFAPKVYMSLNDLPKTQLMGLGSTFTDLRLFEMPNRSEEQLTELLHALEGHFQDMQLQFATPMQSAQESARGLQSLLDYLGLVSLVGLALGLVGIGYLLQLFLAHRLVTFGLLRTLGLKSAAAELFILLELSFLGLIGAILVLPAAWLILPALNALLNQISPMPLALKLGGGTAIVGLLLGAFLPALIAWPLLRPLRALDLRQVLIERELWKAPVRKRDLWAWGPALLLYFAMAVWVSHSFKNASIFLASLLGASALMILFSGLVLRFLPRLGSSWWGRQARLRLMRSPLRFGVVILALSLGTLLLVLLPQLRQSLQRELEAPVSGRLPSFFLFDIQDEQVEPLRAYLEKRGLKAQTLSPLVRARILSVNDVAFERGGPQARFQSREEETDARFRNRGVNLTFRPVLSETEKIVDGKPFSGHPGPIAELSVEEKYADRLGLKIGDRMRFDVQGIEIQGRIVNLRSVQWNSFQPNFFITFQTGFLEDAPKTWLASLPPVSIDQRENLQNRLVENFPNVSIIDVSRVVGKLLELTGQMTAALTVMAALSVLVGLFVLLTVFATEANQRSAEWNLYKVLGATRAPVLRLFLLESALVSGLAAVLGGLSGVLLTLALMHWMFAMPAHFQWVHLGLALLTPFLFSLVLSWNLARRLLAIPASSLLAEGRL